MIHFKLVSADSGTRPSRPRHYFVEFGDEKLKKLSPGRNGIRNTHHKLNMRRRAQQSPIKEYPCTIEHRGVEYRIM